MKEKKDWAETNNQELWIMKQNGSDATSIWILYQNTILLHEEMNERAPNKKLRI